MDARKRGRPQSNANSVAEKSKSGMTSQSRNYRAWTNIEETKLVEALVIMVNTGGFRADQGFKSGYLTHLEHLLKKSMPNSGILGKPHIESKIKVMKRDWQTVHDMLNSSHTSGFSYDTVKHCMIADDQVWESYLQVHKGASKWRNKTFPYYEKLCVVFGKDRVEGNTVRDLVEMEEEANIEEQTQHLGNDSNDMTSSHIPPMNVNNMQYEETSSVRNNKRKGRVDLMVKGFNDAVTCLADTMGKIANTINKDIEREEELDKKRCMITCEISKMESLIRSEKFKAITKIREEDERVNIFWDLQETEREDYVKWVLEE
ncbi:uncharacterized protein At2g29880 isoform X1 [Lactuca sativa]|uniref:Myb/SANT-like domain-containing protein n=1 Tax=Lactuca sativa TaxID=4236 RepID=A0A9R1VF80_LACSA|nr:uncharacterized protein At2g29880 isoform X1 [Lactuca sativa]KAJ0205055.1 hypothetical protein LSAT_V11C500288770 [Lactuca sativa]